jgi:hypothetical protein
MTNPVVPPETTPSRPTGRPSASVRTMLELPEAGHVVARRWLLFGMGAYLVLALAIVGALLRSDQRGVSAALLSIVGIGPRTNWAIFFLVTAGVVLTVIAAVRVARDIRSMAREEADIDWVHRTGKPGLLLVFADPAERERKLKAGSLEPPTHDLSVETLMDDRVRRVRNASVDPNAGGVSPEDLKGLAEARTAQYGSLARYVSSLLLLLAVLGTFAGVKTALPGLISSISLAANATTEQSNAGLIASLNAVAEAFGGNALALIGAIAVGLMAQGIGFGRRNLLERLELVSAEFLYAQAVTTDANPMQAAMAALRETAREMHSASGAMLGIEDQLQQLGREFRGAFEGFANKISDIAVGQDEALHQKTSQSLEQLERRVLDLADAMEANAKTYAGLAEAVKNRSQEATRAFDTLAESNKQVGAALESIVRTGEQSRRSVDELGSAVGKLTEGSDKLLLQVQHVTTATQSIAPAMSQLEKSLAAADQRFGEMERMSQDGWRKVGSEIAEKLKANVSQAPRVMEAARGYPVSSEGQSSRVLDSIAEGLRRLEPQPPPSIWRQAAGPFLGIVIGSGLVALIGRLL